VKLIVACGQFAPAAGAIGHNTAVMRALAAQAARAGAAVLVLPELCLCGYPAPREARARAVPRDGPELLGACEIARQLHIAMAFGFAEAAADGGLYNSMAYVDAGGRLSSLYRKVHLWATEKAWAQPGDSFRSFDAGGQRAGMWICYDSRFPEAARALVRDGATLALVGSAWFGPAGEWELALRARALDNGIYVAGASVLGSFGSAPFFGESLVVDPHGTVLARARRGRRQVITAEVDTAVVEAFRARLPLLSDLRPDSYA
jgi:predicted amidohydrolase